MFYYIIFRTWFVLPPLTTAILGSENLLWESTIKSSWIDEQKNREKDLDEELASLQCPIRKLFFYKYILMNTKSFLSKSSLNATKIQNNIPTKIQLKTSKELLHIILNVIVPWRKFSGSYFFFIKGYFTVNCQP